MFFFILQRCFAKHTLEVRNEMLLTAVAKIIGYIRPIGIIIFTNEFRCREQLIPLELPLYPDPNIILEKLLEPSFAFAGPLSNFPDGLQPICLNSSNNPIYDFDVSVILRALSLQELGKGADGSIVL